MCIRDRYYQKWNSSKPPNIKTKPPFDFWFPSFVKGILQSTPRKIRPGLRVWWRFPFLDALSFNKDGHSLSHNFHTFSSSLNENWRWEKGRKREKRKGKPLLLRSRSLYLFLWEHIQYNTKDFKISKVWNSNNFVGNNKY